MSWPSRYTDLECEAQKPVSIVCPLSHGRRVKFKPKYFTYQTCSVTQLCLTLFDPIDYSTPGFLVLPYLPEFAQVRVRCIGDDIQPSHPLSSVQSLSRVQLFATPWTVAWQAYLSITNSWSLPKLMSIESVMPSNHLVLCRPLLLPPSIFPSIRVFSSESVLCIRWPKYWSFSFSVSPSNEYSGLISFGIDWLDLLAVEGTAHVRTKLGLKD